MVTKIAATQLDMNHSHFKLSDDEMRDGCKHGLDSYADKCCASRHARVELFVEGKTVTARGFSNKICRWLMHLTLNMAKSLSYE